jgi:phosphatidylserine decarboxylase
LNLLLHHDYQGPQSIECQASLKRGQEMGWFEHGSTIIVLAPPGLKLHSSINTGHGIKAGEPIFVSAGHELIVS